MEEILKRLVDISQDPYGYVAEEKQRTGKKVVGLTPMHRLTRGFKPSLKQWREERN